MTDPVLSIISLFRHLSLTRHLFGRDAGGRRYAPAVGWDRTALARAAANAGALVLLHPTSTTLMQNPEFTEKANLL